MNPDLLCPDIVQILTWAVHHPDAVGPALAALGDPEVLFSSEATVTALGGLLARAGVDTVCRAVRCPETARRVRWVALFAVPAPTPDEVSACVTRALRWQVAAVENALDYAAVHERTTPADLVALGALVRRREDLESAQ